LRINKTLKPHMYLNIKHIMLVILIAFSQLLQAQLVYIDDLHVQVNVGTELKINGNIKIVDSTLYNLGNIHMIFR